MRRTQIQTLAVLFPLLFAAANCSATFTPKTCSSDSDCGTGLACAPQSDGTNACVSSTSSSAALTIGMSAPGTGPNEELGLDMQAGVQLAFAEQNAAGGVHGRQLVLEFLDDQYTPALALTNTDKLLNVQTETGTPPVCPSTTASIGGNAPISTSALVKGSGSVLALLGNVGTPTMEVSAPVTIETGTLFFGAFTGATTLLRDTEAGPCAKYIFNVRASYLDETRATTEYFDYEGVPDATHFISFDQNDAYGNAGYTGLIAAYTAEKGVPAVLPAGTDATDYIQRFRYTRNDVTSVPAEATAAEAYISTILGADTNNHIFGVEMTDTYGEGVQFIQLLRQWQYTDPNAAKLNAPTRLTFFFSNISFSGANALAQGLVAAGMYTTPTGTQPYTTNVSVSQVVPNYQSDKSSLVIDYLKQLGSTAPSFTSLEGYAAAQVFIGGLVANTGDFTSANLISTFENLPANAVPNALGGGSFSPTSHNFSKSVYGTAITPTGNFTNLYYWVEGTTIQFFE